jgi:hypothetical protein
MTSLVVANSLGSFFGTWFFFVMGKWSHLRLLCATRFLDLEGIRCSVPVDCDKQLLRRIIDSAMLATGGNFWGCKHSYNGRMPRVRGKGDPLLRLLRTALQRGELDLSALGCAPEASVDTDMRIRGSVCVECNTCGRTSVASVQTCVWWSNSPPHNTTSCALPSSCALHIGKHGHPAVVVKFFDFFMHSILCQTGALTP